MRDRFDYINIDEIVPGTMADVFIEPIDPETDLGRCGATFRISMMNGVEGPRFGLSLSETTSRRLLDALHTYLYVHPLGVDEDDYEPQDA